MFASTTKPNSLASNWKKKCLDTVTDLAVYDNKIVVTSASGEIMLIEDGEVYMLKKACDVEASVVCFTFDGKYIVTSGDNSVVSIWDLNTRRLLDSHKLQGSGGVKGQNGTWIENLDCSKQLPNEYAASVGKVVIVGSIIQHNQYLLGPLDYTIDSVLSLHGGGVACCCYGSVFIWKNSEDVKNNTKSRFEYEGWLVSLAISPNIEWIAAGCNDHTIRLWKTSDGKDFLCGGFSGKISQILFSKDGNYLATCGANQCTVWDFSGKGPAGTTPVACIGFSSNICALAFQEIYNSDSELLLAVASADGNVKIFNVKKYVKGNAKFGKPHISLAIYQNDNPYILSENDVSKTVNPNPPNSSAHPPNSPVTCIKWFSRNKVIIGTEDGTICTYQM